MSESVIADITLEPEPSCIRKAVAWETIPWHWYQFISNSYYNRYSEAVETKGYQNIWIRFLLIFHDLNLRARD